ncbi:hypothetical protein IV203_007120 [Nitzschia inconspicua]|uniref:Uncharacterized protein n=1 Tax=Nitzschia inconspicua TaxID=303405 RepID=A0A9K3PC37_9STRA|nr:hypothetical protein IV203_007120 [Nitzschia inconspicua]
MGRSKDDFAAKEEAFSALLQRIQRQYNAGSQNNAAPSTRAVPFISRPPDEAAYALGRGLAQSFLKLTSKEGGEEEGNTKERRSVTVHVVPKGIQEQTVVALADRRLNPSVCQGFFDVLLQNCQDAILGSYNDTLTNEAEYEPCFVNIDAWLPAWILYSDQKAISDREQFDKTDEYDDDWLSLSLDPLSCMIRAYAPFVKLKILQQRMDNTSNNAMEDMTLQQAPTFLQYHDPRSLSHPSSFIGIVAKTYGKLQTTAGRLAMLREFTKNAFAQIPLLRQPEPSSMPMYKLLLTPLMACSVLSASATTFSPDFTSTSMTEAIFCMEGIWKEVYLAVFTDDENNDDTTKSSGSKTEFSFRHSKASSLKPSFIHKIKLLRWLTDTLDMFLISIPSRCSQSKVPCKELAHRWMVMILDLGSFLVEQAVGFEDPNMDATTKLSLSDLDQWFDGVISGSLLRLLALIPSYRVPLEDFWDPLKNLTGIFTAKRPLSLVTTFKLATIAVSHPVVEEIPEILNVLAISIESATLDGAGSRKKQIKLHPTAFAILRGLGSIFLRDKFCALATANLLETLSRTRRMKSADVGTITEALGSRPNADTSMRQPHLINLIQLLEKDQTSSDVMIRFIAATESRSNATLSPTQQSGLLIFGIGLLDGPRRRESAYGFFQNFLQQYPHLGVSLLPVMVDSINAAAIRGEGDCMVDHISFLCEHLVQDTQCAREIWNLLGIELMRENIPAIARASIIRMFPKVCVANKKLYKRIIELMGHTLLASSQDESLVRSSDGGNGDLEVRLAIAATTAELAKDDLIRDPTDVIGWIQGFIADAGWVRSVSTRDRQNASGRAALVYYAILSLHYLVLAQELDYKLVLVVLGKRLCSIHDTREVSKLPPLVLESLILLLGDGETDDEKSDEDRRKPVGPSPQAVKSVDTLINLWYCEALRLVPHLDSMYLTTILNCRGNLFVSLSKYSFEALGLDNESIQVATNAANSSDEAKSKSDIADRYNTFKHLVEDGIVMIKMSNYNLNSDGIASFTSFASKLIKFEEECLGSSLWRKKGSLRRKGPKKEYGEGLHIQNKPGNSRFLPSFSSILKTYTENNCQATALAVLLSFEGNSMTLLDDLAKDAESDHFDPIIQALFVQSWLNATRNLLNGLVSSMASSELLDKTLLDLHEWRLDNPDAMHICLSCIAMHIPEILGRYGDHSSYVKDISNDVWDAYNSHAFDNPDIARLCVAFVGVCDLSLGSTNRLRDIVQMLEASVTGYGGQPNFGAFFGLGIIAQSCATFFRTSAGAEVTTVDATLITQIVAFLLSQLNTCILGSHEALGSLVKCVKKGEITPEVIEALTAMKKKSLKISPSKLQAAKSIFISFAVCLPAVTIVNDELLLGIYCLLEGLAWGCGKGFCLPTVLHCCRETGLFEASEIETMYQKYAKLFEASMENGTDGIDDIFYAVTAIQSKAIPYSIRKFMVGNRHLFDEGGRALSLVSVVVSVASIPCLGRGSASILKYPCLTENISDEDVAGVAESVSEGTLSTEWNQYSKMSTILKGFLASLRGSENSDRLKENDSQILDATITSQQSESLQLPTALPGTVLDVVVTSLQEQFKEVRSSRESNHSFIALLGCLEGLSLPAQFADVLESIIRTGDEALKEACIKIIVSQIRGRPRAVFDGREFTNLALKISRMPILNQREFLGEGSAAELFLRFFGDMLAKFVSETVDKAAEGVFRYCVNAVGQNVNLIITFLQSIKRLFRNASNSKSFRFSPKAVSSIQMLLMQRVFAGLRDASWTSVGDMGISGQRSVLEAYTDCLSEISPSVLQENDFFSVKQLDGFVGESVRIQVIMILVRSDYFESASRVNREIGSAMAWICRQLVACNDDILSCTILRVACSVAQATENAVVAGKTDLLLSLLDNLLMVSAPASFVGLEILGLLVYLWSDGNGSNGELSMLFALDRSPQRWQDLSPESLKDAFRVAVCDLPFNLARYTRREKLSKVVCNRLWRMYIKWLEQGATDETLHPIRRALITCRDSDVTSTEDLVSLVTTMVSEREQ